jgi:hypothetical protein
VGTAADQEEEQEEEEELEVSQVAPHTANVSSDPAKRESPLEQNSDGSDSSIEGGLFRDEFTTRSRPASDDKTGTPIEADASASIETSAFAFASPFAPDGENDERKARIEIIESQVTGVSDSASRSPADGDDVEADAPLEVRKSARSPTEVVLFFVTVIVTVTIIILLSFFHESLRTDALSASSVSAQVKSA